MALVDVNEHALDIIRRLTERLSDERDLHWTIEASTERRDVLPAADIVTTAIGVAEWTPSRSTWRFPTRYGCVQPVGDTTGPGGLARALRHVPCWCRSATTWETLCPLATLYNFTNPLTVLTQAVNKLDPGGCAVIGLCIAWTSRGVTSVV